VRLQEAGLDSLPGGGGEIFAPAVRSKIGLGKCTAEAWLTTMYVAHSLGMYTSATMMFGHIEGHADRIHHMRLVREWQDRALREFGPGTPLDLEQGAELASVEDERSRRYPTRLKARPGAGGHYVSFISWPFQRENTPLGRVKDWGSVPADDAENQPFPGDVVARLDGSGTKDLHPEFGRRVRQAGATEYLRTQATGRLFLDNIYSIGSSWVTMGPHIGQLALHYGANDMGSVMMEENVVSAAGTTYCLDEPVLNRLIRTAGFTPAQRDNVYDILKLNTGPESPDLVVTDWSKHRARALMQQNGLPAGGEAKAELTVGGSR